MLQDTKFTGYGGADGRVPRASRHTRSIDNEADPQAPPRLFLLGEDIAELPSAPEAGPVAGILPAGLSRAFIVIVVVAVVLVAILINGRKSKALNLDYDPREHTLDFAPPGVVDQHANRRRPRRRPQGRLVQKHVLCRVGFSPPLQAHPRFPLPLLERPQEKSP